MALPRFCAMFHQVYERSQRTTYASFHRISIFKLWNRTYVRETFDIGADISGILLTGMTGGFEANKLIRTWFATDRFFHHNNIADVGIFRLTTWVKLAVLFHLYTGVWSYKCISYNLPWFVEAIWRILYIDGWHTELILRFHLGIIKNIWQLLWIRIPTQQPRQTD